MNKQKAIEKAKKLGQEYKYVALDVTGWWHAFKGKPKLLDGYWYDVLSTHKILFMEDPVKETLTKIYDDE